MSVAPSFFHDGHFPFCVPSMTTTEIDDLFHVSGSAYPYTGLIRGKSLAEVWKLYWLTETITVVADYLDIFDGDAPKTIELVLTLPSPAKRACNVVAATNSALLYPETLNPSFVNASFQVGGATTENAEDPFGAVIPVPAVIYDSTAGTYCFVFRAFFEVSNDGDGARAYLGSDQPDSGGLTYPVSTFGTLFGEPSDFHYNDYSGGYAGLASFGDETYFTLA